MLNRLSVRRLEKGVPRFGVHFSRSTLAAELWSFGEDARISRGHVMALAAVTFFERDLRPLARNRRRPQKQRPERFEPLPPDPATGL